MRRLYRNPEAMTPAERLAEMGAILALAVRRMRHARETGLDDGPDVERPCASVDAPESHDDEGVA